MIILIVDDSSIKVSKIKTVIDETNVDAFYLVAQNKAEAMAVILENHSVDLMILDLNIPNRDGEDAKRLGGLSLLHELNKRAELSKPKYIIGLTAYKDIKEEVEEKFAKNGWLLITYDPTSSAWEETIRNKVLYIESNNKSNALRSINALEYKSELALIMKGGGIKGLAYVGALEELTKFYDFDWYAGTSAGAISAILLSAGYSHSELSDILKKNDFKKFKDSKFFFDKFFNLFIKGGLYNAETFTLWMQELLSKKLESSSEVKLENLKHRASVYASTQGKKALIYDSIDPKTKETPAAFAARCSMSIPFIFIPQQNNGYKVFDGGTQNNYPVEILLKDNPNTKFIGLYLGDEYFRGEKKKYILSNLLSIWTESNDNEVLEKYKEETIVIDPKPISTLQFSLNEKEKEFLQECGRLGALKFLKRKNKIEIHDAVLNSRIDELEKTRANLITKKKRKSRLKRIILVAVFLLIALLGWFFFFRNGNQSNLSIVEDTVNLKENESIEVLPKGKTIIINKTDLNANFQPLLEFKKDDTLKIMDTYVHSWSGVHNCSDQSRVENELRSSFGVWKAEMSRNLDTLVLVDSDYIGRNVSTDKSRTRDNRRRCNSTGTIDCWIKFISKN